ncbi:glycosyltransferase [Herbiconiux moechotypicola]|uniref:Glycosyltransferase 2-like domain-containing protein n=1 Tax=Herbiconiux moechotypicola TaxID=637393 RepID=A0ABP5QQ71_9MICO|nr:glycosyltransferase [Herbiconiux moechotypicola]MCS5731027.1 glycosyltransferase [Herbiconiux moechotypicola]
MTDDIRASVCMATYNGAAYVAEQIESIVAQLGPHDELVVVDDCSTDDTAAVVVRTAERLGESRILLTKTDTNVGYVRAFEAAIRRSRGRFVFLSDQDDVWLPGRHEDMIAGLSRALVVAGNHSILGRDGARLWYPPLRARTSRHHLANLVAIMIGYRPYFGCAMGFRREAIDDGILPFPGYLTESHDVWIAITGNVRRSIRHLDRDVTARRLHDSNQTPLGLRGLPTILRARLMLARLVLLATTRRRAALRSLRARRSARP